MTSSRQGAIGLTLAAAIIGAALTLHLYLLFLHRLEGFGLLAAPLLVAIMCWLYVGLFIVAHDAMHGSLAPGRPGLNRLVGRIALRIYAGFSFDALIGKHMEHHRSPGTEHDPDFSASSPRHFWPWYVGFMRRYFGLEQFAILFLLTVVYRLLGAPMENILLLWALPAILSSAQLFYFGTYLPHRQEDAPFADRHNARTSSFSWLSSLLSCYHFGYHHEHHLSPHVPWWRLPAERRRLAPPR